MKVISTNIGLSQTITWKEKEVKTGIFKKPVDGPVFLSKMGVLGDDVVNKSVHGGIDKSCYLYSANHYSFWREKYPNFDFEWGAFGENLSIAGLMENKLHIGDVLEIGESIVKITQPRLPCFKLGVRFGTQEIVKQFLIAERSGIYVKVIKEGAVKTGDQVYLLERKAESLTVTQIFNQFSAEKRDQAVIEQAIHDTDLASSILKDLNRFRQNS